MQSSELIRQLTEQPLVRDLSVEAAQAASEEQAATRAASKRAKKSAG